MLPKLFDVALSQMFLQGVQRFRNAGQMFYQAACGFQQPGCVCQEQILKETGGCLAASLRHLEEEEEEEVRGAFPKEGSRALTESARAQGPTSS